MYLKQILDHSCSPPSHSPSACAASAAENITNAVDDAHEERADSIPDGSARGKNDDHSADVYKRDNRSSKLSQKELSLAFSCT